ncbi:hypothetical protein FQR65_LT04898 [Abscondita terminalis]|nr:hypothetical protein FQR65_LT04898 [Abscondita terminalis]
MMSIPILFVIILCSGSGSVQLREDDTDLWISTVIKQVFNENDTLYIIFDHFINLELERINNPYVVIKNSSNISLLFSIDNVVLYVENVAALKKIVKNLQWSYHDTRCLVITKETNEKVFDHNFPKRFLKKSNPFDTENKCGRLAKKINSYEMENCAFNNKIINLKHCPITFLVDLDNVYSLPNVTVIGKISWFVAEEVEKFLNANLKVINGKMLDTVHDIHKYGAVFTTQLSRVSTGFGETEVIFRDNIKWVVPLPEVHSPISLIGEVFQYEVWILFSLTFIGMTLIWWLIVGYEKKKKFDMDNLSHCLVSVASATLCGVVTITKKSRILYSIVLLYLEYILIMQTAFKANLVQFLTVRQYERGVSNLEEMVASNLSVYILPHVNSIYFSHNETTCKTSRMYNQIKQLTVIVNYEKMMNVVHDILNYKNKATVLLESDFELYSKGLGQRWHGFVNNAITGNIDFVLLIKKSHYLLPYFNRVIVRLCESGIFQKVTETFNSNKNRTVDNNNLKVVLTLNHLYFMFILWGVGLLVSAVVFILEKIVYKD